MLFFILYLFASLFTTPSDAQLGQTTPDSCSLASFDRCGPANQVPGTASTCNATVTPGNPAKYNVDCIISDAAQQQKLNPGNCMLATTDICNKLTSPHVQKDTWVWSNPAYLGCALGFWLPSGPNGSDAAFAPDYNRCMVGIYTPMITECTKPFASWINAGSVNLKTFPSQTTNGEAVDDGYPSYMIIPAQLTT
ncbi:MAG: hypothetical protein Q9168_006324 [Polycauliona sp. 1 TL-2023]